MSEPIEESLDRRFDTQLQIMHDVFFKSVCPCQNYIIKCWLLVFDDAHSADKNARNCLMTVMLEQLRQTNKLGTPFSDLANTKLPLVEVLTIFETNCALKIQRRMEQMQSENETEESSKAAVVEENVESDPDANYGEDRT